MVGIVGGGQWGMAGLAAIWAENDGNDGLWCDGEWSCMVSGNGGTGCVMLGIVRGGVRVLVQWWVVWGWAMGGGMARPAAMWAGNGENGRS